MYLLFYINSKNHLIFSFTASTPKNILEPVKKYYIFDGWYQNSSYTGEKITSSQLTESTLLYAKCLEMVINATYDSTNNTFTATNFTSSVTLTSFIENSNYDYTFINATGSEIRRVEVTVSYTNNTGNSSSQLMKTIYLTKVL